MSEKKYNFNEIVNRRDTDSLKYDFAQRRGRPADVLPLWVADMDFKTADEILDAIVKRTEHGIFGYTESGDSYFEAVKQWMKQRHDWDVDRKWLLKTPGVVFALAMAVQAYTEEGDHVLIQQPVYYPFSEVIEDNNRVIVENTLLFKEDGKYHIDFGDFEKKIVENQVKLFFLCNPHNPVGRVWTKEELTRMGEICLKHQVLVVSDEIHEDFTYAPYKHTVFAGIRKEFADITVTCTSPGKTFNLAGLQISNIFISNPVLKKKFRHRIAAAGYSQLNTMGLTACEAAYRYGSVWYDELMEYLKGNIAFLRNYLKEQLPEINMIEPEGTYLVWLDFRKLNLTETEREELLLYKAGLWLDSGAIFGSAGEGFERVNIACPRQILETAMEKLKKAIKTY